VERLFAPISLSLLQYRESPTNTYGLTKIWPPVRKQLKYWQQHLPVRTLKFSYACFLCCAKLRWDNCAEYRRLSWRVDSKRVSGVTAYKGAFSLRAVTRRTASDTRHAR